MSDNKRQGKKFFVDVNEDGKNIKDVYKFTKKIGSGGYGSVYLAINKITGD
jgi:serine/threonine protein kinase